MEHGILNKSRNKTIVHVVIRNPCGLTPTIMDESVFTSALELNLNRLISDQFTHWYTEFKRFLSFTDVVKELEEDKRRTLLKVESDQLPTNCSQWIKTTTQSSGDFVVLFSEDFRPKLANELAEIEKERRDALKSLKEAQSEVKEASAVLLQNLNEILIYFKQEVKEKKVSCRDPWLNELAIRHFSAEFLDKKSEYLTILYRNFVQIQNWHAKLSHKLSNLSDEFLCSLERFGLALIDEKSPPQPIDFSSLNLESSKMKSWEIVLKNYSLDYEWKLSCPPLDGFLSTLYNHLKSLGAHLTIETGAKYPKIFSENSLRFGFLQKSISGILTRSWQVSFVILQPSTGFLHFYKVNKSTGTEGQLLIPTPGTCYTKTSLQDLNTLAAQFYLQNSNQPASISPQILEPFLSIRIGSNCKVVASDPETFYFTVKPNSGEKFSLKAFCEEEFVDWVICLNETIKRNKPNSIKSAVIETTPGTSSNSPDTSSTDSTDTLKSPIEQQEYATTTFPSVTTIVDLENPWE